MDSNDTFCPEDLSFQTVTFSHRDTLVSEVTIRSWLSRLINPTLHVHSGLANLESTITRPNYNCWRYEWKQQLCHSPRPVKPRYSTSTLICRAKPAKAAYLSQQIRRSWDHEPFPQGRDKGRAKLRGWIRASYKAGCIVDSRVKGLV